VSSSSAESESFRVLLHLQHFKTRIFQSRTESVGIYGNKRVADMNDPHIPVLKTVATHEKTAGAENAEHLTENCVLKFASRDMMKHGE
jgi:hypothetical protein